MRNDYWLNSNQMGESRNQLHFNVFSALHKCSGFHYFRECSIPLLKKNNDALQFRNELKFKAATIAGCYELWANSNALSHKNKQRYLKTKNFLQDHFLLFFSLSVCFFVFNVTLGASKCQRHTECLKLRTCTHFDKQLIALEIDS